MVLNKAARAVWWYEYYCTGIAPLMGVFRRALNIKILKWVPIDTGNVKMINEFPAVQNRGCGIYFFPLTLSAPFPNSEAGL